MIARGARLDPARPGEIRGDRAADRAEPGFIPERGSVIHRFECELLTLGINQRFDLGQRRAGPGGKHQFLGLVQGDAGEIRQVEREVGLSGPADRPLRPVADDLQRLAAAKRPLDGGFDILGVAGLEGSDIFFAPN